jgi:hypothetical protein
MILAQKRHYGFVDVRPSGGRPAQDEADATLVSITHFKNLNTLQELVGAPCRRISCPATGAVGYSTARHIE